MDIFNTEVYGWTAALRAMRNPMDSWDKADTDIIKWNNHDYLKYDIQINTDAPSTVGQKDLELLLKLAKNGTEHRKVLRMIQVWVTWILPRYVWTEADTYKVSTTRMSCSTMHKLGHRPLVASDFQDLDVDQDVLDKLNSLGQEYREGGKKDYSLVRKMKRRLPEGFLQRADMNFNYETLLNMFKQRYNHRLEEWRFVENGNWNSSLCNWIYSLPHMDKLIGIFKNVAI